MAFDRFERLIDILKKAQESHPAFSKRLKEAEALGRWELAVGAIIAKHSRAIRVQERVLWVEVDHPIWKSELHHRKRQILDLLNGKTALGTGTPGRTLAPISEKDVLEDILFLDPRSGDSRPSDRKYENPRKPAEI